MMPNESVYVARHGGRTGLAGAIVGVFRSLDSAKLECERVIGSGMWEQDDADCWTLHAYTPGHEPIGNIVRWQVKD